MKSSIKLIVSTPVEKVFDTDITKLSTKTLLGSMEVLPGHSPMIAILQPTLTKFIDVNGKEFSFDNSKGIMKVDKDKLIILCDHVNI